jgi:acetyl esterase
MQRLLAGRPLRRDGRQLAVEAQLLLRLLRASGADELWTGDVAGSRAALEESARMLDLRLQPVASTAVTIPGPAGEIPASLYTPGELPPCSPLLVYYHGGGWVLGSLRTSASLCRYLALTAQVRVLSVSYRLAPEHPFPAAVHDARAAYDFAVQNARQLGATSAAIAVGGDSAGANLATVVAASNAPRPAFALLLYPRVDLTARRRSRDLFGSGYLLTDRSITELERRYLHPRHAADPRASVLLNRDLSDFPPTYLSTAGFDPLRDEGNEFAAQLIAAGAPVMHREHEDLIHGYATLFPLGGRFRAATFEAAAALGASLDTVAGCPRAPPVPSTPGRGRPRCQRGRASSSRRRLTHLVSGGGPWGIQRAATRGGRSVSPTARSCWGASATEPAGHRAAQRFGHPHDH